MGGMQFANRGLSRAGVPPFFALGVANDKHFTLPVGADAPLAFPVRIKVQTFKGLGRKLPVRAVEIETAQDCERRPEPA